VGREQLLPVAPERQSAGLCLPHDQLFQLAPARPARTWRLRLGEDGGGQLDALAEAPSPKRGPAEPGPERQRHGVEAERAWHRGGLGWGEGGAGIAEGGGKVDSGLRPLVEPDRRPAATEPRRRDRCPRTARPEQPREHGADREVEVPLLLAHRPSSPEGRTPICSSVKLISLSTDERASCTTSELCPTTQSASATRKLIVSSVSVWPSPPLLRSTSRWSGACRKITLVPVSAIRPSTIRASREPSEPTAPKSVRAWEERMF